MCAPKISLAAEKAISNSKFFPKKKTPKTGFPLLSGWLEPQISLSLSLTENQRECVRPSGGEILIQEAMEVVLGSDSESRSNSTGSHIQRRVGLLYDERMCKHYTPDNEYHPENPNRVRAIWNKLQNAGILER